MKRNGFTLVELMIVIVVIGVLAAIAMPKFQSAADRTKVAEAPLVLTAIAGSEEAYRIANGNYKPLKTQSASSADSADWEKLGLSVPATRYFNYSVAATAGSISTGYDDDILPPQFTATASLVRNLSRAKQNDVITIDQSGKKEATAALNMLIPSFQATAK